MLQKITENFYLDFSEVAYIYNCEPENFVEIKMKGEQREIRFIEEAYVNALAAMRVWDSLFLPVKADMPDDEIGIDRTIPKSAIDKAKE